jgi:hypothetical protein
VPCPSWIDDASAVLDATALLVALAAILTATEFLALRQEFRRHGLFDPKVAASTASGAVERRLVVVPLPAIAGVQVFSGCTTMVVLAFGRSPAIPLVVLAITTVLQRFTLRYGGEGSDDMSRVLTVTTAIALVLSQSTDVVRIALLFIAAQLCLAYIASGAAKLYGDTWRSGKAVQRILHTEFGHPGLARSAVDRWPAGGKIVTWVIIGFEVAFPIGIVLGGWFTLVTLGVAAVFQTSIAVSMGLNRFTPWFLAAFPATAWAACQYGLFS